MRVRRKRWLVLAALLCSAVACLAADSVVLNSGKTLEGQIVSENDKAVVLKTAAGTEIVNTKDVREIKRDKKDAAPAAGAAILKPAAAELLEKAERAAEAEDIRASSEYYQKSAQISDSIILHRRVARVHFRVGERIKDRYKAELEASQAKLQAAWKGAWEDRHSFFEDHKNYKKFNPNNPAYVAALEKHGEVLKKVSVCFPFYEKAQEAFGAVLRLAPDGKDFDAAGHLPLCLTVKGDQTPRVRGRQMLLDFLKEYKPSTTAEQELFKRCQGELERVDTFNK